MGDLFESAFYEMAQQLLIYCMGGLTVAWCLIGPSYGSLEWFWLPAAGSSIIIGLHYVASASSWMTWFSDSASSSAWYSSVACILVAISYCALYIYGLVTVAGYIQDPEGQGKATKDLCNNG